MAKEKYKNCPVCGGHKKRTKMYGARITKKEKNAYKSCENCGRTGIVKISRKKGKTTSYDTTSRGTSGVRPKKNYDGDYGNYRTW